MSTETDPRGAQRDDANLGSSMRDDMANAGREAADQAKRQADSMYRDAQAGAAAVAADASGAIDSAASALEDAGHETLSQAANALSEHRAHIGRIRDQIAAKAPVSIKAAQTRFVERVNQILGEARPGLTLDPEAVLKESALYAERGDIAEELARLQGHLTRFDEVLRAPSEVGRRLEFLLQEMLREANTIGSKSLDLGISHDVVEVKAEIEKMKEQVQNLE